MSIVALALVSLNAMGSQDQHVTWGVYARMDALHGFIVAAIHDGYEILKVTSEGEPTRMMFTTEQIIEAGYVTDDIGWLVSASAMSVGGRRTRPAINFFSRLGDFTICESHVRHIVGLVFLPPADNIFLSGHIDTKGQLHALTATRDKYSINVLERPHWRETTLPGEFKYKSIAVGREPGEYFLKRWFVDLRHQANVVEYEEVVRWSSQSGFQPIAKRGRPWQHPPSVRSSYGTDQSLATFDKGNTLLWAVYGTVVRLKEVKGKWTEEQVLP